MVTKWLDKRHACWELDRSYQLIEERKTLTWKSDIILGSLMAPRTLALKVLACKNSATQFTNLSLSFLSITLHQRTVNNFYIRPNNAACPVRPRGGKLLSFTYQNVHELKRYRQKSRAIQDGKKLLLEIPTCHQMQHMKPGIWTPLWADSVKG